MPKPNYKYEKRQKEIAKQKKKEEKLKRKLEKKPEEVQETGKAAETSEQPAPVVVIKEDTGRE